MRQLIHAFVATTLLVGADASAQAVPGSGSAPRGPAPVLLRTRPKVEEIRLEVELFQQAPIDPQTGQVVVNGQTYQGSGYSGQPTYSGSGVSIGVPVLVRTSWCDTDFSNYRAIATLDGMDSPQDPAKVFVRTPGSAEATLKYEVPFPRGACENLLLRTIYQVQSWELVVDEGAAARSTWPREWPSGMARFLKAEQGIDPAQRDIKAVAEGATAGGPRSVSPFLAAKYAVVKVAKQWKLGTTTTSLYGQKGALRGINFYDSNLPTGAASTGGTPVELAATCVAALRSINIPSRIVYCMVERSRTDTRGGTNAVGSKGDPVQFRFICEFFLPDIGWVPFDPLVIRQQSVLDPSSNPVKGFANVPDLQKCLPLAFRLVPEGYDKADRFALWGWKGQVSPDTYRAVTRIGADGTGRGNGKIPTMPAPVSDEAP